MPVLFLRIYKKFYLKINALGDKIVRKQDAGNAFFRKDPFKRKT